MILTYKIKHNNNFSTQLSQARQIANYAISNKTKLSSKHVAHIGLKSVISNQILRKYGRNKKIHTVSNIKLIVPNQGIQLNKDTVRISSLNVEFSCSPHIRTQFSKINQIEIDNQYYYVSVEILECSQINPKGWIGIDRNTNGHCAVSANSTTNKVEMLGKSAKHIHTKYSKIRRHLQRLKKYSKLRTIKKRESNKIKDLNHKISRRVVNQAKQTNCGIKLEKLTNIRKSRKQKESFRYTLNSWSYYQLEQFIKYKAKLLGVPVIYIEPAYTSQTCHKCGLLGKRNAKSFKCPHCGHTSHADVNASWNICNSEKLIVEPKPEVFNYSGSSPVLSRDVYNYQLVQEGVCTKGNTDIPQIVNSFEYN